MIIIPITFLNDIHSSKNIFPFIVESTSGRVSVIILTIAKLIFFMRNILMNSTIKNIKYAIITYKLMYCDIKFLCETIADFFNNTCDTDDKIDTKINKKIYLFIFITSIH